MKKATTFLILSAGAASAHGGHGAENEAHWLSQGDHIAVVALTAAVLGFGARVLLKRRGRKTKDA
ncbi:hypothetical protein [Shimia aestuarii]|uniref:LPXTG-motif cell wall anchor domain-containing protein n=1 Tax=Shimia aestuarii TaxID=254406 RepID=A0A1I4PZB9_9RHOB|nr:hypothetical protein [Shimia aestuarii]SFM33152.1 hypothetical protein SAMN04488042_106119 [Shimia aestuarii]